MHRLGIALVLALVLVLAEILWIVCRMNVYGCGGSKTMEPFRESAHDSPRFPFVLPIYIISLPVRKERRLDPLMKRIESDDRYSVQEVHAVDGAKDLVDDRETFLSRGQIGCWLSHAYFWKIIAERPEPFALILEDDALIDLPDKYDDLVDVVQGAPSGWDVIYLGGEYQPRSDEKDHTVRVSDRLIQSNREMWYAHAYLITKDGAAKSLEQSADFHDKKTISTFDTVQPLDVWQTVEERNMKVYNTDPVLIHKSNDGISDTYDVPPV